jgi:hypothetical protein
MAKGISGQHKWVAATNVELPDNLAKHAFRRETVRIPAATKVDVLEVYCGQCRRPYDAVEGEPCVAAESRDHLIGGPTGERAKRKHPFHDCQKYGCTLGQEAQTGTDPV